MSPIKGKWKGIISLYSCCKYTSLYMTKLASVWNRANGAVEDDVACVEGFTASQPLNESLWRISFWDLGWAACLWFDPCPERLFWTFGLWWSSSLTSPSVWDAGAETLQLGNIPFRRFARKSSIFRESVHFVWQISAQQMKKMVQSGRGPRWTQPHPSSPTCGILLTSTAALNLKADVFNCLGNCSNWI